MGELFKTQHTIDEAEKQGSSVVLKKVEKKDTEEKE